MNPSRANRVLFGSRVSSHPSLLAGLSLSLDFENAANLGLDRTGQNNLTNGGNVSAGAGHVGNGSGHWVGANGLSGADSGTLRIGSGDFTLAFWLFPELLLSQSGTVVAKWSESNPEYEFAWNKFSTVWNWRVGLTSAANQVQIATAVLPMSAWSFVELGWIHSTATASITVNNGTPATTTGTVVSPAFTNPLLIGQSDAGVIGGDFAGSFDNLNVWQRQLTADERAFLASGVPGSEYPF